MASVMLRATPAAARKVLRRHDLPSFTTADSGDTYLQVPWSLVETVKAIPGVTHDWFRPDLRRLG